MSLLSPIRAAIAALALLVALALGALAAEPASASFTTTSGSAITTSADTAASWVSVLSQPTDPDGLTGYATQYRVTPVTLCASGQDANMAVAMGRFPTWTSGTYTFNRVVTVKTPASFPDPSVTAVTVAVTRVADSASGRQPLSAATLNTVGAAGGSATVNMGPGVKLQLNITVTTTWWWFLIYGDTYEPHITLSITFAGAPSGYYLYDYPVPVTIS